MSDFKMPTSLTETPSVSSDGTGASPPLIRNYRIDYDLLYQYVAGRYPRIMKRLADKPDRT